MSLTPDWTLAGLTLPAGTLPAKSYLEVKGTGKLSFPSDNPTAERVFVVAWDEVQSFVADLLGWSEFNTGGGIHRVLPDEHPTLAVFFASAVTVEGLGPLDQDLLIDVGVYDYAQVTCTYQQLPYAVRADDEANGDETKRYLIRNMTVQSEFLTAQGSLVFVSDKTHKITQPPGIVTSIAKLEYTWIGVPAYSVTDGDPDAPFTYPTLDKVMSLAGMINLGEFDGYPEGTVLFEGATPTLRMPRVPSQDNTVAIPSYTYDIIYHFSVKNNGDVGGGVTAGWNHHYDTLANPPVWDEVVVAANPISASANPIYQYGDLDDLFVITPAV